MHRSLALVALLSASVLGAQESEPLAEPVVTPYTADDAVTIDPGMTREQVVARLGAPAAVRTSGTYTYLFFVNGCHRSCGTDDVVILEDGRVTDAIFRGLGRRYTGTSSSPVGVVPAATLGARPARASATPRAILASERAVASGEPPSVAARTRCVSAAGTPAMNSPTRRSVATSTRQPRSTSASRSASAGNRWPPVPPATRSALRLKAGVTPRRARPDAAPR